MLCVLRVSLLLLLLLLLVVVIDGAAEARAVCAQHAKNRRSEDAGTATPDASFQEVTGGTIYCDLPQEALDVVKTFEADHRVADGRPVKPFTSQICVEVSHCSLCARVETGAVASRFSMPNPTSYCPLQEV
jgi:hypothetical protein